MYAELVLLHHLLIYSRVVHNKGRKYDEYGFCISGDPEGSIQSRAACLQKQSQARASQAQVIWLKCILISSVIYFIRKILFCFCQV